MSKQIDERITRVLEKFEEIRGCTSCWNEPLNWYAPMSEEEVAAYEKEKSIRLPEEYRRFITSIGANGNKLFYGIAHLDNQKEEGCIPENPFPFSFDNFPFFLYMTEEELDNFDYDSACSGFLHLNTEGCGMDSVLMALSGSLILQMIMALYQCVIKRQTSLLVSLTGWNTGQNRKKQIIKVSHFRILHQFRRHQITRILLAGRWDGLNNREARLFLCIE